MKLSIFGSTGALGRECLAQSLDAQHQVTVLVRTPSKLPAALRERVLVVEGNGLDRDAVAAALPEGTEGVLFAVGIDKHSPEDLCTDITRHILASMPGAGAKRLVWCGGGSTLVEADHVNLGARFVEGFASLFMGLRHRDKAHQLALLEEHREIDWIGVRPLQMRKGPMRGLYHVGFDPFSGLSKIHFADCAHAMIGMLDDDTWLHQAPIIQY
jgi:putative NADH-flavin reductase